MKKFVLCFLCLCFVLSFSACKKADNLNKLSADLTTYSMDINLDVQNKQAQVSEQVKYVNSSDAIIKMVKFHLYPQFFKQGKTEKVVNSNHLNEAYPFGMSYAEFDVLRVKVNESEGAINYQGEDDGILQVDLINSLLPKESVNIYIEFSLTLPNCYHRFGYGENTINLANFYPIACVYENGEFNETGYNPNGDPFYSDMANYNVSLTLNSNYVVSSTGELVLQEKLGSNNKFCYKANMVRDFAMVVSDRFKTSSAKAGGTNITYYYFDDDSADLSVKAGVDAINTFNKLFGNYPYTTFSIVQTDFVYGGMEYPNLIMISGDIDNTDDYLNVIVHETAHQWWYGMVGNNEYTLPWLDEALTEYSTILFYDYNTGYNLNHKDMINSTRENYLLFLSVYQDVLGDIDTSMRAVNEYNTEPEYTYCTYVKGSLMFDSLCTTLGRDKFIKCLSSYFEANKYTNAEKEDLISAFESTSKIRLKNVFDSWLNGKVVIK